jgi:alpha-galactosidase
MPIKAFAGVVAVSAIDNGLFWNSPPMGWRSWNAYHANVDQALMENVMDAVALPFKDGKSIKDLGFVDVGLDDNWQMCGAGVDKSFHDANGNPIVNLQKFPDMKKMTDHAHSHGLSVGWYGNNCICSEHEFKADDPMVDKVYHGDVAATVGYGFDGIKLDGCGEFRDLDKYAALFNATGRHVSIENCHWGGTVPSFNKDGTRHCPWNFFRTSGDITNNFASVLRNLATTTKFQDLDRPLAGQGCWTYPDMLEVGNLANFEEDRSHFGAWVITSSPLILGYDMLNRNITERVWPIISNAVAIGINQEWAGHPGFLLHTEKYGWNPLSGEEVQIWLKPQKEGMALFLLNAGEHTHSVEVKFSDVKWHDNTLSSTAPVSVLSVWDGKSSEATGSLAASIDAHDSALYLLKNKASATLFA